MSRKQTAAVVRAANAAEVLVKAIPALPIELHLEVHAKLVAALIPILRETRANMRAECIVAIQHVPDYADLLYKSPEFMHKAVEGAVRRVRC